MTQSSLKVSLQNRSERASKDKMLEPDQLRAGLLLQQKRLPKVGSTAEDDEQERPRALYADGRTEEQREESMEGVNGPWRESKTP